MLPRPARFIPVLVVIVLCLPAAALAEAITVRGAVLRADGSGLPTVRVELLPMPTNFELQAHLLEGRTPGVAAAATTGSDGRFALVARDAGLWRLRVSAPGFVPMHLPALPLAESVELPPVRLRRAAAMPIAVVDDRGHPLAGAGIYAFTADAELWQERERSGWRVASRFGWTDAEGRLSLPRARGERLDLWARLPGQLAVGEAKAVRQAQITLERPPEATRNLVLRQADGTPEAGALVSWAGRPWPLGLTDESGSLLLHGRSPEALELLLFSRDRRARKVLLEPGEGPAVVRLQPTARLAGRVLDEKDRGLAGALVWPAHDPAAFARTDDAGRYVLRVAARQRTRLQAHAPGFLPRMETTALDASGRATVDFRMLRSAVLVGRVVDEAGRPVSGVRLAATAPKGSGRPAARRLDSADARAFSEDDGSFQLRGLVPGTKSELVVTQAGYARTRQRVEPSAATATDREAPAAVEVVLHRGRLAFGRVVDQDERPLVGAEVRLSVSNTGQLAVGDPRREEEPMPPALTDERGRFEIETVLATRVDLAARGQGFSPLTVRGVLVPDGAGPVDLGTLILVPGVALNGRVTDGEGEAIAGVGVWRADGSDRGLFLSDHRGPARDPDAAADQEGRFTLADLEPGHKLDLWIDAAGFLPAFVAGAEAPDPQPFTVVLEQAAFLRGMVVDEDGAPIADAEVGVAVKAPAPDEPATSLPYTSAYSAISDAQGSFAVDDVPPGVLEIDAYAPGFQPSAARSLELAPGQEIADLRFVLARGAALEGHVLSAEDQPIADAQVLVGRAAGRSDDDGAFRVAGIPPGRRRVEVRHPGYNRLVQELDVAPGVTRADFLLSGGHEVAGQVIDADALPLADVALELESLDGGALGGYTARSGGDGAFRFPRVADGRYRLHAARRGFVAAEPGTVMEVAGGPIADLEVRLQAGARIEGRILGLDFEELARVEVRAAAEDRRAQSGEVDFDGRFEIVDLAPGDWQVRAQLDGGGRQARVRVTLEPGVAALTRDLSFGGGLVLSGVVLHGGEPLAATLVTVRGHDRPVERGVETDLEGRFRVADLEPGFYGLGLANHRQGLIHNENVYLAEDRDLVIEIATAQVSGIVFDAATGQPIPEVLVRLKQLLPDGREGSLFARPGDTDGAFHFARLTAGRYQLNVQHNGFQPAALPLDVPAGGTVSGVSVELRAAAGLELWATLASGRRPRFVTVHARDAGGRIFAETRHADAEGFARFSTLPAGSWTLMVGGTGGAGVETRVEVPGEPLAVVLPDAGRLRVRIPELTETDTLATLTVTGPEGRPFRHLKWGGALEQAWPVVAGRAMIEGIPAGVWALKIEAPSGEVRTGTATTTGGPDVEVSLE